MVGTVHVASQSPMTAFDDASSFVCRIFSLLRGTGPYKVRSETNSHELKPPRVMHT